MPQRSLHSLFEEYGESHRHPANVLIHWFAVPLIYFSITGLLMCIPSPGNAVTERHIWALIALLGVWLFYASRSLTLSVGMAIFSMACFKAAGWLEVHAPWPLWAICLGIFAMAWVAQFIGHGIEGKKPSFLKDLLFLMVGPAWLMAKLYRAVGLPY